jgi:hypothetical protein
MLQLFPLQFQGGGILRFISNVSGTWFDRLYILKIAYAKANE